MPAPIRRTDELGFPIPGTFDEAPDAASAAGRKVRGLLWRWRWVLLILLVPLLFYDKLLGLAGHWIAERAIRQGWISYYSDNLPGALAEADRAIYWEPDKLARSQAYALRGQVHQQMHDLNGGAADFTHAIELLGDPQHSRETQEMLCEAYDARAWIRERLGQHHDAIDDATAALKYADWQARPVSLNQRAYIRALAGLELDQGLDDINQALAGPHQDDPMFLDTRGYLRLQQKKYAEAVKDFDNAIDGSQRLRPRLEGFGDRFDRLVYAARVRDYYRNLAVMRHHRGEAYDKLGKPQEAHADFDWADQHGYNPADGTL